MRNDLEEGGLVPYHPLIADHTGLFKAKHFAEVKREDISIELHRGHYQRVATAIELVLIIVTERNIL